MQKKYIIAVVAIVVVWAAFMGIRHFNKKDENRAHREDTHLRMLEMAKKSPRAGLYEMADAIKRYHADKKAYPPNLGALYPDYMSSKAFIEEIDWSYEPGADNFFLSKAATYNNQAMVASIDKTMRPEVETSGVMVATRKAAPRRAPEVVSADAPELFQEAISEDMVLEVVAEHEMTLKEVDVVTAAVSPELRGGDRSQRTEEKVNVQTELSRIVTLVGEEAVSAEEAKIGYNLEHYMVWKDLNGAIGVSNVEFPDRTDMYVAVKDRWYNVKRRQPDGERETETAETQTAVVETQKSTEEIAAGFSRNYLVWKSGGDGIGVGDTQYPDKERLMVAFPDGWSELERPAVADAAAGGGTAASFPQRDIYAIAADISRRYLVWKNKDGSIGIGDTKYPDGERLEVASKGEWAVLADEEPMQEHSRAALSAPRETDEQTDEKLLAAGIGGQYLMWKDKNGQIGFGNVDYPELGNVAYVHSGGNWQKIAN